MQQNRLIAKELNKNKKKLHYQAATALQMKLPGTLSMTNLDKNKQDLNISKLSGIEEVGYSILSSKINLPQIQKTRSSMNLGSMDLYRNYYHTGSGNVYGSLQFLKDMKQFKKKEHLPILVNPLVESKKKQQSISQLLETKGSNPFDAKEQKFIDSIDNDRKKAEALLQISQ
mmetsp:Transcript_18795/g.13621  ORF Transcript_18795/g.13621 Transcript_18795/m.13621 type:complete len:172 (+) Transcript_18795:478-993(+)